MIGRENIHKTVLRGLRYTVLLLFTIFLWKYAVYIFPKFSIFIFPVFIGLVGTIAFSYYCITFERKKLRLFDLLRFFVMCAGTVFLFYLAIEMDNGNNPLNFSP